MSATFLLRLFPRPLLLALDAWSYRVARKRALKRQQRWLQQRKA